MENNLKSREVTVLLVSDNDSDIREVNKHLEKTMGILCHIWHCPSIIRSSGFFKKELPGIDIVLLDLDLVASGRPREIFQQMQTIVGAVPIIVFTERKDHELALMVVEEGAADNVTRGQFSTDPYKLRDAIEFSLARTRISKKTEQNHTANVIHIGDLGAADIKSMQERQETVLVEAMAEASIVLKEAIEHGKSDLQAAGKWADVILEEVLQHGKDDLREARAEASVILREAIERGNSALRDAKAETSVVLRQATEHAPDRQVALTLKKAVAHGENNLKVAKAEAAAALKDFHDASTEREREHAQIIHWMGGGYSMEKEAETKT